MKSMKLKDALRNVLSQEDILEVVRGYDVVGDVAVIIIPGKLQCFEKEIAETILRTVTGIRTVAKRDGKYRGEFRLAPLVRLAGEGDFETRHKEFGLFLHVDPARVYFSPRSASERHRIACSVSAGERVLVMFSGIAPLPLMVGLHSHASAVFGIEKNPVAHIFALQNLEANRRVKNVTLLQGDVEEVMPQLSGRFDRIAMPLPHMAEKYLVPALHALRKGGMLHYYDFCPRGEFCHAERVIAELCRQEGRRLHETKIQKCGHVASGKYRICVDATIV
jgi:tRNA (guanine37-N1)-methyltransferase